jgi:alkylhydroperoxidase family enzyme
MSRTLKEGLALIQIPVVEERRCKYCASACELLKVATRSGVAAWICCPCVAKRRAGLSPKELSE